MQKNPNGAEAENQNAQANSNTQAQTTETEKTVNPNSEAEQNIDYKTKFSESSREAQRLLDEKKESDRIIAEKEAEIARLKGQGTESTSDVLYPGFEELDPEAQENLRNYTSMVENRVKDNIYKDPAIIHSRQVFNEKKWSDAFEKVSAQFPDLRDSKDDFKAKYFQPNNVPDNIDVLMVDMAKMHLFDKAKFMGAEEEKKRADRIDMERSSGGDKTPPSNRTIDDYAHMAQENPAKFAKISKEFNADLAAGKLQE